MTMLSLLCVGVQADAVRCVVRDEVFPTYGFDDPDPIPAVSERRYPYSRYDGSTPVSAPRNWQTVTLENDSVKVTLMPAIGGKVWGATDQKSGAEVIYYNHVVKFRDIAMRGPWCSGGIEYNFGIIGHAPSSACAAWRISRASRSWRIAS